MSAKVKITFIDETIPNKYPPTLKMIRPYMRINLSPGETPKDPKSLRLAKSFREIAKSSNIDSAFPYKCKANSSIEINKVFSSTFSNEKYYEVVAEIVFTDNKGHEIVVYEEFSENQLLIKFPNDGRCHELKIQLTEKFQKTFFGMKHDIFYVNYSYK